MQVRHATALAIMIPTLAAAQGPGPLKYPDTRRADTVETLHGRSVPDPYRWLEDPNSAETKAWVEAENRVTFGFLEQIPARAAIKERLTKLWNYERYGTPSREGDWYIYAKNDGLQNQSVIYKTKSVEAPAEILIDPNSLSKDGTVALGGLSFSDDGKYLAYSLAASGSDWLEWHVRDVATARDLPDVLKWSKFSSAAWLKDGSGFYYSRYDAPKDGETYTGVNKFQKVFFHKLGTSQDADVLVYERKDQPDWGFSADVTEDGRFLLISQSEGTKPENRVFVKDLSKPDSTIQPFLDKFDADYTVLGNDADRFYVLTDKDAPKKRVVAIDLAQPDSTAWKTILPESKDRDVLGNVRMVANRFVTEWLVDAHEIVKLFALDGTFEREVQLPAIGSLGGFSGRRAHTESFYGFSSFAYPGVVYRYDFASGKSTVFKQPKVEFSPDAFETVEVFYPSRDGTKIPLFLTYKKGLKKDGQNPTYLYGYGGFNIPMTPAFSPAMIAWMEMGGVFAQASLRGGGEYGKTWYDAGRLAHKQNVFDDFISAGGVPDSREVHLDPQAGDCRRQQRRPAGGGVPDAAAGSVRRRVAGRWRARHAALPQVHDRLGVEIRLRRSRRLGRLRDADEVLAAAHAEARDQLPADADHDLRSRRPRRAGAQLQVRRRHPGRAGGTGAGADPHRDQGRTRRRQADQQDHRGARRHLRVPGQDAQHRAAEGRDAVSQPQRRRATKTHRAESQSEVSNSSLCVSVFFVPL